MNGELSNQDKMIKINGKTFRCECGCNVFREVAKSLLVKRGIDKNDDVWPADICATFYECNSCKSIYHGE